MRAVKNLTLKKFIWSKSDIDNKLKVRKYKNYNEYIKHQRSKLEKLSEDFINEYDIKYRKVLYERLLKQNLLKPQMNVLCLDARIGTEVKAFIDRGCFAIGIDINPGIFNKYVVYGDFHDIQFASDSVDVVFSNSIDHSLNLEILIKEIKRVLKVNGLLIIEVTTGEKEGRTAGYYESLWWDKIKNIIDIFKNNGFLVIKRDNFTYPWKGQHITLKLINKW